jgi:hypothetical protein
MLRCHTQAVCCMCALLQSMYCKQWSMYCKRWHLQYAASCRACSACTCFLFNVHAVMLSRSQFSLALLLYTALGTHRGP